MQPIDDNSSGFIPPLTADEQRESVWSDEAIAEWTSTHDEMRMGESVIPTHLVTARMRQMRDAYRAENAELLAACEELTAAMHAYSMDVDESPPYKHRKMMNKARAAIERSKEQP